MWVNLVAQVGEVLTQLPVEDPPLLRDYFSLDWDDIISLLTGIAALVTAGALYVKKRSETKTQTVTTTTSISEEVNEGVLAKFTELFERIAKLERELAETRVELRQALTEIAEMHKLEEFLQASLHEKDAQIRDMKANHTADLKMKESELVVLRTQLDVAKQRITRLEAVCRKQGFDVDEFNESNGYNK